MREIIFDTIAWILFALGAWLSSLNFYLSFIRYPIHRFCGHPRESYKFVSGIPLIGSLFVALSFACSYHPTWFNVLRIGLILIDTGGLHWFAFTMLLDSLGLIGNTKR